MSDEPAGSGVPLADWVVLWSGTNDTHLPPDAPEPLDDDAMVQVAGHMARVARQAYSAGYEAGAVAAGIAHQIPMDALTYDREMREFLADCYVESGFEPEFVREMMAQADAAERDT